jgi:hypothetical protein
MVPIPADPQRVLEDESVVFDESLFNRHIPAEEAFFMPLQFLSGRKSSDSWTQNTREETE